MVTNLKKIDQIISKFNKYALFIFLITTTMLTIGLIVFYIFLSDSIHKTTAIPFKDMSSNDSSVNLNDNSLEPLSIQEPLYNTPYVLISKRKPQVHDRFSNDINNYLLFNVSTDESLSIWKNDNQIILDTIKIYDQIHDIKDQTLIGLLFIINSETQTDKSKIKKLQYLNLKTLKFKTLLESFDIITEKMQINKDYYLFFIKSKGKFHHAKFDIKNEVLTERLEFKPTLLENKK